MIRILALAGAATLLASSAPAQFSQSTPPSGGVNAQLVRLLNEGYDIKAAFAEAGVPYVVLQKGASAYLCRGGGASACEKLN